MRQTTSGEGTKIAQAAKELNVTSVTIRRYLSEFVIQTTTDGDGVKVLPGASMDELREIRRLKEEGLTNPKVMEFLEEHRGKRGEAKPNERAKADSKASGGRSSASRGKADRLEDAETTETPKAPKAAAVRKRAEQPEIESEEPAEAEMLEADSESGAARSKHSLTCQTCGKVFEHMNPRLRDCLDCYRTKRKERRRGGAERHKNVIQHPIAQQATTKNVQQQVQPSQLSPTVKDTQVPLVVQRHAPVRNYRKAIEETRTDVYNLKRRLERPDLPEGERRWLEQIYAYQLILHQGWRHLSEYKSAGQQLTKAETPTVSE